MCLGVDKVPDFYVADWSGEKLGLFYVWAKEGCYE